MKKIVLLGMLLIELFSPMFIARAEQNSKLNDILPLKMEEVNSVQVQRLAGESRTFQINDGYEEVIIRKVVNWINSSRQVNGVSEIKSYNSTVKLTVTMKNGDIAFVEPIFLCDTENSGSSCSIIDGQVLFTYNDVKVQLQTQELYDWLLVGWKSESYGASKEELLDETLYFQYFTHLDKKYADFIMCPRINRIERIVGSTQGHIIQASALNYAAHHGDIPFDRIHLTLIDTPENGVEITNVSLEKGISEKESKIQCRKES